MTFQRASNQDPSPTSDHEVIRVDFSNDQMGIAAALRQAFNTAATEPSNRDFDKLLSELH